MNILFKIRKVTRYGLKCPVLVKNFVSEFSRGFFPGVRRRTGSGLEANSLKQIELEEMKERRGQRLV